MRQVRAVIGANYGDEGKGKVTDCFSSPNTLNIRYNGTSQAGHTVVTPEGKRHVFKHFGSGTFRGAQTYLSPYFVLNPIGYCEEFPTLGLPDLKVFADPTCEVITPYDIMLNQVLERSRGGDRHGSCGWGFNEALQRYEHFPLQAKDLKEGLREKLIKIRDIYVPFRAHKLNISIDSMPFLKNDKVLDKYIENVQTMFDSLSLIAWKDIIEQNPGKDLLFEGAQGLQLDMDNVQFPYVTHSKTGLYNVLKLIIQAGIKESLDVFYVTRTYLTRHGAGPMPHNHPMDFVNIVDETNVENENQGELRFSWLDLDYLKREIDEDKKWAKNKNICFHLALTCLDQLNSNTIKYVQDQQQKQASVNAFRNLMADEFGFNSVLMSYELSRESKRQQWVIYGVGC